MRAAQGYLESGKLKAAVTEFKNVLQQEPDNGEARLLLGSTYMRLIDSAAAEKELRHARKAGIARERWIMPLGRTYLMQRKPQLILDELQVQKGDAPALQSDILNLHAKGYLLLGYTEKAHAALIRGA